MLNWLIGILGSSLIAGAAYKKRSLSKSGTFAAIAVGTLLFALGSPAWFGTLIAFFVSSSLLTQWRHKKKEQSEAHYAKTGVRDAAQVLANGGVAALLCIFSHAVPSPAWWIAFIGVLASVTADTWATEIGSLSRSAPRSILTWKRVPAGTSGGVTLFGLGATVSGGAFIGLTARALGAGQSTLALLLLATAAGTAGSLADSLLGARLQVMYRCPDCGTELEKTHHCGLPTIPIRGWQWMNNDAVNLLSSLIGGAIALLIWRMVLS